jgi:hypothetical protein
MIDRRSLKKTKKRLGMKRGYKCKYCGAGHWSSTCFQRPRKPMAQQSKRTKDLSLAMKHQWRKDNPPDKGGHWLCYLRISLTCPIFLDNELLTYEHVRAKVRSPALKFCSKNIRPACESCNKLKGSWSVTELAESYPQVFAMVTTPEWQAYEEQLDILEAELSKGVGLENTSAKTS